LSIRRLFLELEEISLSSTTFADGCDIVGDAGAAIARKVGIRVRSGDFFYFVLFTLHPFVGALFTQVTGMLLEAVPPSEILQLLSSEEKSARLLRGEAALHGGGGAETVGPQVGNGEEEEHVLTELVSRALETFRDYVVDGDRQSASASGALQKESEQNAATSEVNDVGRMLDTTAVLLVDGNGFRRDLLDHPMQVRCPPPPLAPLA
jgi:hypothetical protein